MRAKWRIEATGIVVAGRQQWVWRAISPALPLFSQIFIDEFVFPDQPSALSYVLDQLDAGALAEATA